MSQIDAAYVNDLQLCQESNNNNILISILLLFTICIKIRNIPNNNHNDLPRQQLEKLKLILILSFLLIVIQMMNANLMEEEIDDVLNVYEGDRRLENFLPRRNRSFEVLTEENSRFWTRFNKGQLINLYQHLRIPNIVQPNVRGGRRRFSGQEVFIFSLTKIAHGSSNLVIS